MIWKNKTGPATGAVLMLLYVAWILVSLQVSITHAGAESAKKSSAKSVKHNRLINESSPYLLQHATNPVDWYPWGKEAFEKAKKENKPIFLSIGYSTCHWCRNGT